MLGSFLAGNDRLGVFDRDTYLLNDSSRVAFESFVREFPGTTSSGIVQAYLDILQSSDYQYSDKVDSFLLHVSSPEIGLQKK